MLPSVTQWLFYPSLFYYFIYFPFNSSFFIITTLCAIWTTPILETCTLRKHHINWKPPSFQPFSLYSHSSLLHFSSTEVMFFTHLFPFYAFSFSLNNSFLPYILFMLFFFFSGTSLHWNGILNHHLSSFTMLFNLPYILYLFPCFRSAMQVLFPFVNIFFFMCLSNFYFAFCVCWFYVFSFAFSA
jgi:hypothetical protein